MSDTARGAIPAPAVSKGGGPIPVQQTGLEVVPGVCQGPVNGLPFLFRLSGQMVVAVSLGSESVGRCLGFSVWRRWWVGMPSRC